MAALAGDRVEYDYPFGPVGVVGKAERVGRAGVPDALGDLGVEMVMTEQHEVGLKRPEVDLDLVDVSVPGLDLLDPRVGEEQVGVLAAPRPVGLLEGLECRVYAQHLRDGVHDEGLRCRRDLEALIGEPMGEMHLGEGVRQGGVWTASTGKAGCVVVATDDYRRHPVAPDPRESALHDAERTIVRGRVVEDVAEPYQQVRLLRQGKLDGGLEGPLEVPFPLVDPTFDRVREV